MIKGWEGRRGRARVTKSRNWRRIKGVRDGKEGESEDEGASSPTTHRPSPSHRLSPTLRPTSRDITSPSLTPSSHLDSFPFSSAEPNSYSILAIMSSVTMVIYKDIIRDDELLSEWFPHKELYDGCLWEVEAKFCG